MKKLTLEQAKKIMDENDGSLDLSNTGITALPDNLTVGGWLNLRGTGIKNAQGVKQLANGDYAEGRYLYADDILTHIKRKKQIGKYTYYIGKIKNRNVIFDGVNYAHCKNMREGITDLVFKGAKDRGAEQYKEIGLDEPVPYAEAVTMYRVITGACKEGTQVFIDRQRELKETYTPREIIEMTSGEYGGGVFRRFFEGE